MRTVIEYRANAEECRKLAKLMAKLEDKQTLENLAQAWEKLAKQRESDLEQGH